MRARRKLIKFSLLGILVAKNEAGVPMTRLRHDYILDISLPHFRKLLSYMVIEHSQDVIAASLNPEWLAEDGDNIQECPDNYKYKGLFPFGEWLENDKTVH